MSELIDKIFDAEKISAEINTILSELTRATAGINTYKDAVLALEAATRKSKGNEELIKNSKLLNDTVIAGGQEMKRYEAEVQKLKEKTEQLTGSEKAAAIEIAKARLELAAANKATKEAAIAEIELTAKNKDLSGSYNSLQKDLQASIKAYKALSSEEVNSAKGKELLTKIQETQTSLKASDAAMGNYQRNVGNYSSALEGMTPRLGGLAGTLVDIANAAKANSKNVASAGAGMEKMGASSNGLNKGLSFISAGFKGIGQSAVAMGKVILANPILFVVALIVGIFKKVADAIESSEERTNKMSVAMARLAPLGKLVGDVFEVIADIFIKFIEVTGKAIGAVTEFLGINPEGSAEKFAKAEKMKQDAIINTRKAAERASKLEADLENQRAIIADKESYSFERRMQALKRAEQLEKQLAATKTEIARQNLKAVLAENDLDDNNAEANQRKTDAVVAFNKVKQEQAALSRKLSKDEQKLIKENEADLKEQAAAAKATAEKIIAAKRRLIDSQFAIQKESEQKDLALSTETFNRQIEDLRRNGELTKSLLKNLTIAQQQDQDNIKEEWVKKRKDEAKKTADELLAIELKRIEDIQKGIEKQTADLSFEYTKQETDLKKQFANGLINEQEYQNQLTKFKLDSLLDANDKTIASLEQLLTDSKLTDDKRAELSNKLAQLQIDNENAVLDATIKNNDDKVKSDEEAIAKRIAVTEALGQATMEIFGAIADFATQQSEQRVEELEAEQEASDTSFETAQTNLDNALMSDENRIAKQTELDEKKAAADKAIADKLQAEKIKQAKWDKANGIVQAIITSGLAILKASLMTPFIPMGLIAAGLAGTMGAAQIATIASASIPAYEKGTDNHPGGLSLWGEKRPEVAVLPSGETFLAEKPTITEFDAGTKIYKSVSDYESYLANQTMKQFAFDYDKMAGKIPKQSIVLDSRGLWGVISQQNSRRTMINRRYYS